MAQWIKVETITPDKAEMRTIAKRCNCSIGDAFLAWFRVYAWADSQTADGRLPLIGHIDVDDFGGLPGLAKSLEYVGWFTFDTDGATVINFERHNGKSAKSRSQTARRVAEYRVKCNATTATNVTQPTLQCNAASVS